MKKKFSIIFILLIILTFFPRESYAITDSKCDAVFNAINNHQNKTEFEELDYYKVYVPSIKFRQIWDYEKKDFVWSRDKNKNLEIAKINSYSILEQRIQIGDKLVRIDGKEVSKLTNKELDEILDEYNYGFNEEPPEENKKEFSFTFSIPKNRSDLNSKHEKVNLEAGLIYMESQADSVINIHIKNVSDIDIKKNTFEADLEISTIWNLEKLYPILKDILKFKKDDGTEGHWYCWFSEEEYEEMQIGEVFSEPLNEVHRNKNLVKTHYYMYLSDTLEFTGDLFPEDNYKFVEIKRVETGNFTFSNKYNLKAFPFDKQLLSIKIGDRTRDFESLDLRTDNYTIYNLDIFKKENSIIEWKTENVLEKYYNYYTATSSSVFSGVEILIEIQRGFQYYIYKVISPIILILLVCWSVFWIHPRELESKLTITIVCLLSLIAYNFVIDEDLPKLSYLTIIDYIVLLAYIFATIPNFLSIIAFRLQSSGDPADEVKWKRNDKISRIYGPLVFVMLVLIIVFFNAKGNPNTAAFLSVFR